MLYINKEKRGKCEEIHNIGLRCTSVSERKKSFRLITNYHQQPVDCFIKFPLEARKGWHYRTAMELQDRKKKKRLQKRLTRIS